MSSNQEGLSDIPASLAEGIYVLNKDGNFIYINPEAERLLGWTFEEVKNRNAHYIIHRHNAEGDKIPLDECPVFKVLETGNNYSSSDEVYMRQDGTTFPVCIITSPIRKDGEIISIISAFRDITVQKEIESDKDMLIAELNNALSRMNTLQGRIIPICASCNKIRDDKGYWEDVTSYITKHSEALFSHSLCPDCEKKTHEQLDKWKGGKPESGS